MYTCTNCGRQTMQLTGFDGNNATFKCSYCSEIIHLEKANGTWRKVERTAAVMGILGFFGFGVDWEEILGSIN